MDQVSGSVLLVYMVPEALILEFVLMMLPLI